MQHFGGLIQHHVSRRHSDPVLVLVVIQNEKAPRLIHLLVDVDNGGDDVCVGSVNVHAKDRTILISGR